MNRIKQTEYPWIDVVKFFMALVVVAIHTRPFSMVGGTAEHWFSIYSGLAVDYFFVASGFFLGVKMLREGDNKSAVLKEWTVRFIKLYLVWTLIYLPFTIVGFVNDTTINGMMSVVVWMRNFLFVGENFLSWPLWYLLALIWVGGILLLLEKIKLPLSVIVGLAVCLLGIGNALNILHGSHNIPSWAGAMVDEYFRIFKYTRNGLFVGFPYVVCGLLVAKMKNRMKFEKSGWFSFAVLVLSLFLMPFVRESVLFAVCSLFILTISVSSDKMSRISWLRDSSMIIYFSHMLFVGVVVLCAPKQPNGAEMFLITITCTLALSTALLGYVRESWLFKFLFK